MDIDLDQMDADQKTGLEGRKEQIGDMEKEIHDTYHTEDTEDKEDE